MIKKKRYYFLMGISIFLLGCSPKNYSNVESKNNEAPQSPQDRRQSDFGSLAGPEGFTISSNTIVGRKNNHTPMTVNPYLWDAALSVLDFMPLISSDAHGGVLVTDWTSLDHTKKEQTKIMVRIKGCDLNANALSVTVHKRILSSNGLWINQDGDQKTNHELEMLILEKAREIKSKSKHSCH